VGKNPAEKTKVQAIRLPGRSLVLQEKEALFLVYRWSLWFLQEMSTYEPGASPGRFPGFAMPYSICLLIVDIGNAMDILVTTLESSKWEITR
jgi:hypothetical protein